MRNLDTSRFIIELEKNADWKFQPRRWQPDKAQVCLDEARDRRLGIEWCMWAAARKRSRGRELPHLTVDFQWGDVGHSRLRTRSRPLFDRLEARRGELEGKIKAATGLPGSFYLHEETAKADWMMEAGFYWHGQDLQLGAPEMFQTHVQWLAKATPTVRSIFIMEMNALAAGR